MARRKAKAASEQGEHAFNVKTYPYTQCREQHTWKPYDGVIKNRLAYEIKQCGVCLMKRHRIISFRAGDRGRVLSRSYRPPEDYHIVGGITASERGEIVAHNFMQMLKELGLDGEA